MYTFTPAKVLYHNS